MHFTHTRSGGLMTWRSPSDAIQHEACAVCLGDGRTYDLVLGSMGVCSACGGSGQLDDMLANTCDDPRCPDHGYLRAADEVDDA